MSLSVETLPSVSIPSCDSSNSLDMLKPNLQGSSGLGLRESFQSEESGEDSYSIPDRIPVSCPDQCQPQISVLQPLPGANHRLVLEETETGRKLYEFEQKDEDEEDEELGMAYVPDQGLSHVRERWVIFSEWMTVYIPDCILNKDQNIRQAFREKVTLFELFLIISAIFIFVFAILPGMLCGDIEEAYNWKTIHKHRDPLLIIKGQVIDAKSYTNAHPGPMETFRQYFGQDITHMFKFPEKISAEGGYRYKFPKALSIFPELENLFLDFKQNDTKRYCKNHFCHNFPEYLFQENLDHPYIKILGNLTLTFPELEANRNTHWVILYDQVYNISDYVQYGAPVYPPPFDFTTKRKEIAYYLDERIITP